MPTAPTAIPAIPTPVPQTSDPTNFDTRADAVLTALPDVVDGMNDAADVTYDNAVEVAAAAADIVAAASVAADAAGMLGSSSTTLSVSAGSKAITLAAAKASLMTAGRQVVLVLKSDPTIRMFGNIAASPAPTSTTATVTVTSGGVFGTGSYSSWDVLAASFFASAATAAEVREGISGAAPMTPVSLYDALAEVTLVYDTANIVTSGSTLDMSVFINGGITLTKNSTLPNPTNAKPGQTGRIRFLQDGTGGWTLSYGTSWDFEGGTPTAPADIADEFYLDFDVITTTKIRARLSDPYA